MVNKRKNHVFFTIIRSAVGNEAMTDEEKSEYMPEFLTDFVALAEKHDITHLLALGLKKNGLLRNEDAALENKIFKAIYRCEKLQYELNAICNALEKVKIPFVPLKGSVIRRYYPEDWMRTSCDIDVLVHEEDLDAAIECLITECGFKFDVKSSHDVSMFSKTMEHIELHYGLIEDGRANSSAKVLEKVWDACDSRDGYDFCMEMSDEMFYFYHIAHMAKHFEGGGCGIRSLIDLWILDNLKGVSKDKRDGLLQEGGLMTFAETMRNLSRVWFENAQYDETSFQAESYIVHGGIYGSIDNRIILRQQKQGGRMQYALSKIFIPYEDIKFHYPILQKHRWLTPIMEVRRWGKLAFCGHAKRTMRELKYNSSISNAEADGMKKFLQDIGL